MHYLYFACTRCKVYVLANYEWSDDQVRRGRTPRFIKVGRGVYRPI